VMRERTPLPRAVIEHLPRLKLIASLTLIAVAPSVFLRLSHLIV
jgi:hypothetical protein